MGKQFFELIVNVVKAISTLRADYKFNLSHMGRIRLRKANVFIVKSSITLFWACYIIKVSTTIKKGSVYLHEHLFCGLQSPTKSHLVRPNWRVTYQKYFRIQQFKYLWINKFRLFVSKQSKVCAPRALKRRDWLNLRIV